MESGVENPPVPRPFLAVVGPDPAAYQVSKIGPEFLEVARVAGQDLGHQLWLCDDNLGVRAVPGDANFTYGMQFNSAFSASSHEVQINAGASASMHA